MDFNGLVVAALDSLIIKQCFTDHFLPEDSFSLLWCRKHTGGQLAGPRQADEGSRARALTATQSHATQRGQCHTQLCEESQFSNNIKAGQPSAVPRVTSLADDAAVEQAGQQVGHQGAGLTVGQRGDDGEELSA